jgi:hypothetical protein
VKVARFLSAEWFDEVCSASVDGGRAALGGQREQAAGMPGPAAVRPGLVIELVVTGMPEGSSRHQVALGAGPRVMPPSAPPGPAQVRFISDYATVSAIAAGELSTYDALLAGRARVAGSTAVLAAHQSQLAGLDLVPAAARAATTF